MPRVATRTVVSVGVAAVLPLLGGCGAGGSAQPAALPSLPSPLPSASAPVSARAAADRDAVAAYSGMVRTWVEAAKTSDAGSKKLRQYAQGDALKLLAGHLYAAKLQKKIVLGELSTSPAAIDARPVDVPTTVVVRDCLDSTRWLEHKESGEPWDDKPGDRLEYQAIVLKTKEGWKVDAIAIPGATC